MTVFRRLGVALSLACILACSLLPVIARAADVRPNGLDRRVDAIPAAQLERAPAALLVDPDRQIAAERLARWMMPGWLASIVFQILVLAYFWQSGAAAKLRDSLRRMQLSELTVRFLFGASLAFVARLAALLPSFYLFRVGRVMELSATLLRTWSLTWLFNTVVAMVIAGIVVSVVLWLVDRTHQWYIFTLLAIVAGSFAVTFGAINFNVVPSEPASATVLNIARPLEDKAGVHVPIVIDKRSGRTHIGAAGVAGLGPSTQIVIDDTLVAGNTPAELRYAIAHELGEIAARDPVRTASLNAVLVIIGVALAVFIADRIGFRRDDDPVARLALVAALLGCVYIFVAPIDNAVLRSMSSYADGYAVALTGDRDAAIRSVVRAADQRLDQVCPNVMARLFLETSPPLGERVASFNGVPSGCP
ncbi:MAG: M48 family metalloprotease [Candidatus Baltobacteraceae bacterium]